MQNKLLSSTIDHVECSHCMIEAVWTSVDKPGVRLMHLTQSHNLSKSLLLLVEITRLMKNHWKIGSLKVELSTPNLGGGNEDRAPGGILEINYNFARPVSRIFGDHANDLDVMAEIVFNPPWEMTNMAWKRATKYSLLRNLLKDSRASTRLVINLRNSGQTDD